jgi:hypothetical protein
MNLPAQLEAAIRCNDAAAVRDLLREATERERKVCAKALQPLLRGPQWPDIEPLFMVAPDELADLIRTGVRKFPSAERQREHAQLQRDYDEWHEAASGIAFHMAVFGLVGGVTAAARAAWDVPSQSRCDPDIDLIAAVLADRAPDWLADLVDRHLRLWARHPLGIPAWALARKLVRLGAIARPDLAEYTTLMPVGVLLLSPLSASVLAHPPPEPVPSPADVLLSDPGLLDDEVWRLFTVPDAGQTLEQADRTAAWMQDIDHAPRQTWSESLAHLCALGMLDRDRLLDECLGAFSRDFSPHRVAWYARLLRQLDVSVAEIADRTATYLGLLAASSKVGVTVGQDGARRLLGAGLLGADRLLDACGPALLFPQKSVAIAQLKLIDAVITKMPAAAERAPAVAAVAFGHERQDVQEAALALIAKHLRRHVIREPAALAEIRRYAMDLSPSLAPEAAALGLGPDAGSADAACEPADPTGDPADAAGDPADAAGDPADATDGDGPTAELAGLDRRIGALPRAAAADLAAARTAIGRGGMPGPARVHAGAGASLPEPVTDPDELIALLTVLMEDARDAISAERALAGAVRLSALPERVRSQAAGPLRKRAASVMDTCVPFSGQQITCDMALLTHVWAGGSLPTEDVPREDRWHMPGEYAVSSSGQALTMAGIFSARVWEAARVIEAGTGGLLLAEPETRRGAITPESMLERVQRRARQVDRAGGGPPDRHDRDVALLRLAPGAPPSLWGAWSELGGISPGTLQASYRLTRDPLAFRAVLGEPAGQPLRRSEWHRHLLARTTGPVPEAPGCPSWQLLTGLSNPLSDHAVLYGPRRYQRHYDAAVAGWPLICPWQPELAAAHLLRPLSDGLQAGQTPATTAVMAMNDPAHPLGPVGHLALVTGLASAEADTRVAAAQLWSDACADGRLDPVLAATALVTGVVGQALKLSRVADGLQHAANSPIAARRVVETACASAEALAGAAAANLHALIELAARLGATVGAPELPGAVTALASRGGRLGATAKQLVQASHGRAPDRERAAVEALAALVARAEAP